MELNRTFVWSHCESWIHAWNRKDLNKLLSHYAEELIFVSPKISMIFPENKEKTIKSKKELHLYFSKALQCGCHPCLFLGFPKLCRNLLGSPCLGHNDTHSLFPLDQQQILK